MIHGFMWQRVAYFAATEWTLAQSAPKKKNLLNE